MKVRNYILVVKLANQTKEFHYFTDDKDSPFKDMIKYAKNTYCKHYLNNVSFELVKATTVDKW